MSRPLKLPGWYRIVAVRKDAELSIGDRVLVYKTKPHAAPGWHTITNPAYSGQYRLKRVRHRNRPVCYCKAYSFPHNPGKGACRCTELFDRILNQSPACTREGCPFYTYIPQTFFSPAESDCMLYSRGLIHNWLARCPAIPLESQDAKDKAVT